MSESCKGFRVVPRGSSAQARRVERLIDFLIEETLTTPDGEILAATSPESADELRAEIDEAIAKARGER